MRTLEAIEVITQAQDRAQAIADRAHFATESIAYNLARAYTANPYLNRKILATLAISGMDEQQINRVGNIATQRMLADGVVPVSAPPQIPQQIVPAVTETRPSPAMQMSGEQRAAAAAQQAFALRDRYLGGDQPTLNVGNTTGDVSNPNATPYWENNIAPEDATKVNLPVETVQAPWFRFGRGEQPSAVQTAGGSAAAAAARAARDAAMFVDRTAAASPASAPYQATRSITGVGLNAGFSAAKGFIRNAQIGIESVWEVAGNVLGLYYQNRQEELLAQQNEGVFADRIAKDDEDRRAAWSNVYQDATSLAKAVEATQLGQIVRGQLTGDSVDLGSGWFASADLRERQAEAQKELLGTLVGPQGQELIYTLGRGMMSDAEGVALTDNSFIYSLVSGMVDGSVALLADPTKKVPYIGWGKRFAQGLPTPKREAQYYWWQKIAKQLADDDALGNRDAIEYAMSQALREIGIQPGRLGSGAVLRQANNLDETQIAQRALLLDQLGMAGTPDTPIFLRPEFAKWITSADATRSLEYLTRTTSSRQIHQFFKWKIGRKLATDIADAKTPEQVLEAMTRALANPGMELENQLRLFPTMGIFNVREKGLWVKRSINSRTRAGQYLPTGVKMMLNEPTQFMNQFDRIMRSLPVARHAAKAHGRKAASYDANFLDDVFDEMSRAFDGSQGDVLSALLKVEELLTETFIGMGFTVEQAKARTQLRTEIGRANAFMQADLARNVSETLMHTPLAITQLLNDGVFLINPQQLEQTLRQAGHAREFLRHKTRWGRYSAQRFELAEQLADAQDAARKIADAREDVLLKAQTDPRWLDNLPTIDAELSAANRKTAALGEQIDKINQKIEKLDVKNLTGEEARWADRVEKALETGRYYWKMSAIWRLAYTLRVAPEEVARVMSSGAFEGWFDYLITVMPERFGGLGGRYSVDAANIDLVSSSRRSWDVQLELDSLTEELSAVINAYAPPGLVFTDTESAARRLLGQGFGTPTASARLDQETYNQIETLLQRRIAKRAELEEAMESLEKSVGTLWQASIGSDPAKSTATIMRERVSDLSATGHYSVADRLQPGQFNNWVDGLVDRIQFYAGSPDMSFNAGMMDPASQYVLRDSFELTIGGVKANMLDHFNAGRIGNVEEFLAHYYWDGPGRSIWDEWYRSTAAMNDTSAIGRVPTDTLDDAFEWVLRQTEELSYLSAGTNNNRAQQLSLSQFTAPDGTIYDIVPSVNGSFADSMVLSTIHNGSFDGRPLSTIRLQGKQMGSKNPRALEALVDAVRDFGNTNPNAPQRVHHNTRTIHGDKQQNVVKRVANATFRTFYGVPSDVLSRHPLWKRTYWNQIVDLMPLASKKDAARILRAAENAKLPPKMMQQLKERAGASIGDADFDIIDKMASIAATDNVAELLYDASKRGASADALRFMIPFGDAFKEVYSIWGKLLFGDGGRTLGKPAVRLAQALQAGEKATALGPGDIYGIDPETGEPTAALDGIPEGMFYRDPTSGEYMYQLPFSRQIINGVHRMFGGGSGPARHFEVPLRNANIFGSIFPGFMPGTNEAVNYLMPDDPAWNGVRRFLNPFGVQDPQIFPPWVRRTASIFLSNEFTAGFGRLIGASESDPVFQRTRNQIINQKLGQKEYDYEGNVVMRYPPGQEGWEQLHKDAHRDALIIHVLRGIANFIGPAAPVVRYSVETEGGNVNAALMISELRRRASVLIEQGENPDQATLDVLEDFGVGATGYISANNKTSQPGIDSSVEWREWYQNNKEFMGEYKQIAGYFGPTGLYDQTAANALEQAKLYSPMTPDEKWEQHATRMLYIHMNMLRDTLPPESQRTLEDRRFYAERRNEMEKFYGVSITGAGLQTRILNARQMNEMELLVERYIAGDALATSVMNNDTGELLVRYMAARSFISQKATEDQNLMPDGWKTANRAAAYRDELRALGQEFAEQNPGFSRLFYTVLTRELADQEDPQDLGEPVPIAPPRALRPPRQP